MSGKKESINNSLWQNDQAQEKEDAEIKSIKKLLARTKFTKPEIDSWKKEFQKYVPKPKKVKGKSVTRGATVTSFEDMYSSYFPDGDSSMFAAHVFRTFDKDNNGIVTFEEFMISYNDIIYGTRDDKMRWIFKMFDTDQNGIITRDEMLEISQAVGKLSGDKTDLYNANMKICRIFRRLDKNLDGRIDFAEFLEADDEVLKMFNVN